MKHYDEKTTAFVITTNGEEWCRQNFPGIEIINYSDLDQFYILSRLDGCIISNSTYGWWIAYMGQFGAMTVAPDPWHKNHKYDRGIYMDEWIKQGY